MQASWQWEVRHRVFVSHGVEFRGFIRYKAKEFGVIITPKGASCSCNDYINRGLLCKHIAFVAMAELASRPAFILQANFFVGLK